MALSTTAKIPSLPFHTPLPLCFRPSLSLPLLRFRRLSLLFSTAASLPTADRTSAGDSAAPRRNPRPSPRHRPSDSSSKPPSAPWLRQWSPTPEPQLAGKSAGTPAAEDLAGASGATGGSVERIVHRLRHLGLGLEVDEGDKTANSNQNRLPALEGDEGLGELLERSWSRPDQIVDVDQTVLPWEREWGYGGGVVEGREGNDGVKKRRMKAPTLAELTIEDAELRRLRQQGMTLRERISIAKAGVTQAILEKIHDAWRKNELVRLKFHESLAHDMKTAHEIVERRTGGLVIWRAGSVMVVYRGSNYKRPLKSQPFDVESASTKILHEGDTLFVPDVSSATILSPENSSQSIASTPDKPKPSPTSLKGTESMTEEEIECNQLLEGLGPRFIDWWGTGILPVDADLLPQNIPGYKTPFRLLPTGMRLRLTNAEMTNLRKLARHLPCHFALGRNRNHHGLAAAILKLWEKSLVVKIAVKRGIQNTNNKLMAEELKLLTGGNLLLRNKYYIVMYRGKDFIPTAVATVLAERQELTKDVQEIEENAHNSSIGESSLEIGKGHALAGTLAEFQEAQARWGREITTEEHEAMKEEASRSESARLFKKIEHKLYIAQAKKLRAEKLLSKIEASMVPLTPSDDQEMITDEERSVFRRIGLRMKAYLPLGIRGVFDGVIENMHLHWKHRELVKLLSKQKTLSFVEDTARLLEYESGGILVAIERVPKGFALIYYRGKNYQRPICLRPRNLLTKAKALKRSIAMQRHEALSQHITALERTIEQMKRDLGYAEVEETHSNDLLEIQSQRVSEFSEVEDEEAFFDSEDEDDMDNYDFHDENGES